MCGLPCLPCTDLLAGWCLRHQRLGLDNHGGVCGQHTLGHLQCTQQQQQQPCFWLWSCRNSISVHWLGVVGQRVRLRAAVVHGAQNCRCAQRAACGGCKPCCKRWLQWCIVGCKAASAVVRAVCRLHHFVVWLIDLGWVHCMCGRPIAACGPDTHTAVVSAGAAVLAGVAELLACSVQHTGLSVLSHSAGSLQCWRRN